MIKSKPRKKVSKRSTKKTQFRKNPDSEQLKDLKKQYLIAVFEGRFATAEYLKAMIEEEGGWNINSKVYNSTFLNKIAGEIFD